MIFSNYNPAQEAILGGGNELFFTNCVVTRLRLSWFTRFLKLYDESAFRDYPFCPVGLLEL
jgi:hypothetical protein